MAKPRKPHTPAAGKKPKPAAPPSQEAPAGLPLAVEPNPIPIPNPNPDPADPTSTTGISSADSAGPPPDTDTIADPTETIPASLTEPEPDPPAEAEAEAEAAPITPDSFESNPVILTTPDPAPVRPQPAPEAAAAPPSGSPGNFPANPPANLPAALPTADFSRPAPRAAKADDFEQNPLTSIPANAAARLELDDDIRVREALRSVIEQGDSVKEAARDWGVAPSSIAQWRARYQDLLASATTTPLIEESPAPATDGLTYIPEAAREIFTENWERLVQETAATSADFRQSPRQIFLQTSPVTSWLFTDGQLDRGILAGASCVIIGLAILTSFLIADRNALKAVPLPEPAPRDDLVIDEAARVASAFFKATNWEERLKYVRQPDAVRDMMQSYYQENPDGPINDAVLNLAMPARHVVNLSYDVPSQNRSHFLCVVQTRGKHLVDWESSSLYQEYRLTKLRAARSTQPTRIAVTVRKEELQDYYNYAFTDAKTWVCYQLGYPGLNLNLFGYAKRDSSDAITLDAMLGIVDQHAVVMEVRFPPDSAVDNQVEILAVLRNEWVPDDP